MSSKGEYHAVHLWGPEVVWMTLCTSAVLGQVNLEVCLSHGQPPQT